MGALHMNGVQGDQTQIVYRGLFKPLVDGDDVIHP